MTYEIHEGDCLDILPSLPENSIDTCLTDPPYGLSFMGKDWDHGAPGIPFWKEIIRVLKPGAMLLAFGGTRTHHRLMVAIEDAGFEMRDTVCWLYGTGLPKSHDISKAIDKVAIVPCPTCNATGKTVNPNPQDWQDYWVDEPCNVCKGEGTLKGAERKVVGTKLGQPGYSLADNKDDRTVYVKYTNSKVETDITAPATITAKRWNGWGTALKPAWEPIIMAMKPLDGTFVENAQKWGVAGLWIDGGRIPNKGGRWPANVAHDGSDEVVGGFPVTGAGSAARFFYCAKASRAEKNAGVEEKTGKDGRAKRNHHPTVKPIALLEWLIKLTRTPVRYPLAGGVVLDPFMGSGSIGVACMMAGRDFIGIELDPEYCAIAKARINHQIRQGAQKELL